MAARAIPGRRRCVGLLAAAILGAVAALGPAATLAAAPTDRLPDLRMLKPRDVQMVRYATGPFAGHRLLRFTTIITNEGVGPFELRGTRDCASLSTCPTMTVRQRLQRSDGTWYGIATTGQMRYEVGDGHHHWHTLGMEGYHLWALGVQDPTPVVAAKFGFCFFDGFRRQAGASSGPHYVAQGPSSNPGCGTTSSRRTRVGLTAGWADVYPWDFAGQYIDVTGVPSGEYLLCVRADPQRRFLQASTTNDEAWVRLRIAGSRISIRDTKRTSCSAERARWAPDPPTRSSLSAARASAQAADVGRLSFAVSHRTVPLLCRLAV